MGSLTDFFERRWRGLTPPVRAALIAAFFVGMLGHVAFLTNRFFNHDSILYTVADPNSTFALTQGKWFSLPVSLFVQGNMVTSSVIMTVAMIELAVVAALTVSILRVRSPLWGAMIGALLVLFPSVMSANTYEGSALFFASLLMATLAVFVTIRWRHGFWLGIVLLTLSCGTYAVFIGYAAGLFLLLELIRLLDGTTPVKSILRVGLKYILVLAASALLYYAILKALLQINQLALMDYRGIENVGRLSLQSIWRSISDSYQKVYYFFRYGLFLYRSTFAIDPVFRMMNWVTLALCALLSLGILIRNRVYRSFGRLALIVVLVCLFPLAIHAIAVLGQNAMTHWIMCYPFVLVYVYGAVCADEIEPFTAREGTPAQKVRLQKGAALAGAVAVLIVSLTLCRQWYMVINEGYEYLRYTNANTVAAATLLVDDMRETIGYSEGTTPVAFLGGSAPVVFQYTTGDFERVSGKYENGYTGIRVSMIDFARLKTLLRNWIGVAPAYAGDAEVERLSMLPEVRAMPVYPAAGSIALIEGTLVVKLSPLASEG